jgi:hypothetical protein
VFKKYGEQLGLVGTWWSGQEHKPNSEVGKARFLFCTHFAILVRIALTVAAKIGGKEHAKGITPWPS